MTALTSRPMSADEFLAWAIDLPKGHRYELVAGEVVPMSPERAAHAKVKALVWQALQAALLTSGLPGEAFPDGMSVQIDERTIYEPDALLRLGEPLRPDAIVVIDPVVVAEVVVAEVVSPSSRNLDTGAKLEGYFRVPTVRHYLILTTGNRMVTHHRRDDVGRIQTGVLRQGSLRLDPPGLVLDVPSLFP